MEEKEQQIIEAAESLFMRYGFKSITMDDVSRELGISKKTLYQYFRDKKELINKILQNFISGHISKISCGVEKAENAIEDLYSVSKIIFEEFKNIQPGIIYDLQKYYPDQWALIDQFKSEFALNHIKKNIKRGIKEGYYRDNVNVEVVAKLYFSLTDIIFNPDFLKGINADYPTIFKELIRYHIRGLATKKGIEYIELKINLNSDNTL